MWIRELLNDRKWHHGDLDRLGILVRHRGVEGDARVVLGSEVREIRPGGLVIEADPGVYDVEDDAEAVTDGTVFIPYHRILQVTGPDGVLWEHK